MRASIADFFAIRPAPSQNDLDEYAASLIDGSTIHPVGMQGPLSYTVVAATSDSKTIVSFRIPQSKLNGPVEKVAQSIHGNHVPAATYHGSVPSKTTSLDRPLKVYSMPCLEGKPYLEAVYFGPQNYSQDVGKQIHFIKDLAKSAISHWYSSWEQIWLTSYQVLCAMLEPPPGA